MITIPSMPTRFRPLPQLEIHLETHELRTLAFALDRIVSPESYTAGLCLRVLEKLHEHALAHNVSVSWIASEFGKAVSKGMNPPGKDTHCLYIGGYLDERWNKSITDKELATIRDAWARHIARSIYEQIGA